MKDTVSYEAWELFHEAAKINPLESLFQSPFGYWGEPSGETVKHFRYSPTVSQNIGKNGPFGDPHTGTALPKANIPTITDVSNIFSALSSPKLNGSLSEIGIVIFLHAIHVIDFPSGRYFFDQADQTLRAIGPGGHTEVFQSAFFGAGGAAQAELIFLLAGDFKTLIHSNRGYRQLLLECGRRIECIASAAASHHFDVEQVVNFNDRLIDKWLGLDGVARSILSIVAVSQSRSE